MNTISREVRMRRYAVAPLTILFLALVCLPSAQAQTPEQRRELLDLKKELGKVSGMIRKKEFDEAQSTLESAAEKVKEIAAAVGVEPTDRKMQGVAQLIVRHSKALEIARARTEGRTPNIGVSFAKDVAPIISGKCLNCHGNNNPRGNLNLSTFAGWQRGGQSGQLLTARSASRSLIMARIGSTDAQRRMPRNGQALSRDEIRTIGKWIDEGARYDGGQTSTPLADLGKEKTEPVAVMIPKPTGSETVSFTKDIAPFMSNLCGRCHNNNRKSGGLSLVSFYSMMEGGDSGRVVLPGNADGSRLFRLVGGLENPRMPNDNQVRITRKNYEDLKKWFEEGNTFDGDDPKTPLRNYVRSQADIEAEKFASMSTEEFNKHRFDRTEDQWKKAVPNDAYRFVQSDDFLVLGNVPADRLTAIDEWAQDHARNLKKLFGGGSGQLWKGRLAIIVMKDRFGYDEFNQVIEGRRAPKEMTAHTVITPNYENAYICLLDVGDEQSEETGGLKLDLVDHLTGAYMQRGGGNLPDWVLRGTGLALAAVTERGNPRLREMESIATDSLKGVLNPADIFADGTFSPATIGPIGFTLVRYMLNAGGTAKFSQFIKRLKDGQNASQAVRSVYNADLEALGRSYARDLSK